MISSSQPRLKERALADIALIGVPTPLKGPDNPEPVTTDMGRLTWSFSSTYLWASMGSVTAYRQRLVVSVMAADATPAEYEEMPSRYALSYDHRKQVRRTAVGTGMLTVWEGTYTRGSETEPAYQYVFADPAHRLHLVWHAVAREVDLAAGVAQIARIASSFRIVRDPVATFADMRDAPRKDAEARSGRLATVQSMLRRAGYVTLEPGKPVLRNGVYVEWMSDPEPRYQLLVPLGRVRAAANGSVDGRPRPLQRVQDAARPRLAGTIGWREFSDDEWQFSNQDNDYLPFPGIGTALGTRQQDRGFVYFYYAATVRVEETSDNRLLTSLRWFLDGVPDVQRRWREGTLVGPGKPEHE